MIALLNIAAIMLYVSVLWNVPQIDYPEQVAFPGAEGWGAYTRGGSGGRVIKVTNLNPEGPGSLAAACSAKGPRIVIFEVSGVIRGDVYITEPYITIAGQTAPGAGITLVGKLSSFDFGVHDIIVRHLRIRRQRVSGGDGDAIQMGGPGKDPAGTHNIILDHLSLCWGNDEVIDLYNAHDVTVQWCTIEESDDTGNEKGEHNYGIIATALNSGSVTIHHNLWAHHSRRVPCIAPYRKQAAGEFCNNLVYNCRGGYTDDGHGQNAGSPVNIYNNYYRRGPQTMSRMYPFALSQFMDYYVKDNYFEDWGYKDHPRHWKYSKGDDGVPSWIQFNNNGKEINEKAVAPSVTIQDAKEAYNIILSKAGCWPRDIITERTVGEVRNRTGSWGRNSQPNPSDEWFMTGLTFSESPVDSDDDGIPDKWEELHGLDPHNPADANSTVGPGNSPGERHKGYTYIEFFINELADVRTSGVTPGTTSEF